MTDREEFEKWAKSNEPFYVWNENMWASWQAASQHYEQEIANLHTVMMAAAVEITEHWDAHCDSEGYGPSNLVRRLENGFPEQYGYDAETMVRMDKTITALKAQVNRLHEAFVRLREDRKLWKVSGICGQDSYAGLPPAMRIIDEALANTPTHLQEWVGLSEEIIDDIGNTLSDEQGFIPVETWTDFAKAIEAKLRELNTKG